MGQSKWAYVGLIFWWFAIVNPQGEIEFMGVYLTKKECNTIHGLYDKLNYNQKYKITTCQPGVIA